MTQAKAAPTVESTVYTKVASIMAILSQQGIGKAQYNQFDKYNFRGIDDVYNVMSSLLADHRLVVLPRVTKHEVTSVQTSQGKPAYLHSIVVTYTMIDADNPESRDSVEIPGEGMDRGDKGLNKAMSAAYKLWAFQTFCIPVQGGGLDSESDSYFVDEAVVPCSHNQLVVIRDLLSKTNTDEAAFCEWQGVEQLEQLPNTRFDRAVAALHKKLQKMSEEYEAEQRATHESEQAEQGGAQ